MTTDHAPSAFTEAELDAASRQFSAWTQTLPARDRACLAALLAANAAGADAEVVGYADNLSAYQADLGKYNRMFEMYSKIMANSHEMKKALIGNFPR